MAQFSYGIGMKFSRVHPKANNSKTDCKGGKHLWITSVCPLILDPRKRPINLTPLTLNLHTHCHLQIVFRFPRGWAFATQATLYPTGLSNIKYTFYSFEAD